MQILHHTLHLQTTECLQFIDLTERITGLVAASGVQHGLANIQTLHTTTAIIVNEHEPLLLEDMKRILERLAPRDVKYQHDEFDIRTANLTPDERPNGHAHCQAMFLRASETLNIVNGELQLGRWQRIFFVELDGERERTVSVTLMGEAIEGAAVRR
jgi:secondary thiamine-phosphate synthase enzyme